MSKRTEVNVNLKFIVEETGMFPPYDGVCEITCVGADGQEWKGAIKYDDSRGVDDCIKTICRMDSFRSTLPKLAVVASNSEPEGTIPEPVEEKDPYAVIRDQLLGKKVGELRKLISDQNMNLTTGGKKKEVVVEQIIDCLKERDGVTEKPNEEA